MVMFQLSADDVDNTKVVTDFNPDIWIILDDRKHEVGNTFMQEIDIFDFITFTVYEFWTFKEFRLKQRDNPWNEWNGLVVCQKMELISLLKNNLRDVAS